MTFENLKDKNLLRKFIICLWNSNHGLEDTGTDVIEIKTKMRDSHARKQFMTAIDTVLEYH